MKNWLVYILKKVVENLIVNGLKYLLGLLLVGAASLPFTGALRALLAGRTSAANWLLILPYFVIFLTIIYLILRIPMIPRLTWDYIFGLNQHTLCYIDKENLEFTKTLSIWPLSKCVHQVRYDYAWSGSEIDSIALKKIDGEVSVDNGGGPPYPNKGKLLIDFNENPKLLKRCECDVIYQLNDRHKTMERKLVITVKRPTLRIVLRVVTNPCVRLKNVGGAVYDLFGDKRELVKRAPLYATKYGGHTSAQTYYEWEIKHPKLFTKYEITWDIV